MESLNTKAHFLNEGTSKKDASSFFLSSLLDPKSIQDKRNYVLSEMRKSVALQLLYHSPDLPFVEKTNASLSEWTGLTPESVSKYVLLFLESDLWRRDSSGHVFVSG